MKRIVILGCSGAGKSTLARKLAAQLNLPTAHLDELFFEPGWKPGEREAFRQKVAQATDADRWVVDGNFVSWVGDIVLPRADLPPGCRDNLSGEMLTFI